MPDRVPGSAAPGPGKRQRLMRELAVYVAACRYGGRAPKIREDTLLRVVRWRAAHPAEAVECDRLGREQATAKR